MFARVIERLIKSENYQWTPPLEAMRKTQGWLKETEQPSPCIRAIQAECLAELGSDVKELPALPLPAADWYASYVGALVKSKQALASKDRTMHDEAADSLLAAMKLPRARVERMRQAAAILRGAVGALPRSGKDAREFVSAKDAASAVNFAERPLWLARGIDRCGLNDFAIGHPT